MGKQNFATNETTKEAVVAKILTTFEYGEDIARSIEDMELVDITQYKPERGTASQKDPDARKIEEDCLNIEYQEEMRRYLDRRDGFNKEQIDEIKL